MRSRTRIAYRTLGYHASTLSRCRRSPSSRCPPSGFPAFALGVAAGRRGGVAPAVFNAANEAAVALFLSGRIRFAEIGAAIA